MALSEVRTYHAGLERAAVPAVGDGEGAVGVRCGADIEVFEPPGIVVSPLLREAVAEDLSDLPGTEVVVLDQDVARRRLDLREAVQRVIGALVIVRPDG
ncbi:MAG: hypothetical protein IPF66_13870 [Holophagales bacterium]|nr:hypothetical protein [Holophagales bacterium]